MKKLLYVVFLVFFLNACSEKIQSPKVGEIYRSVNNNVSYEIISSTELEITEAGRTALATYSIKEDRVRVATNVFGTTIVQYFKSIPVGLKEDKRWRGDIYYSRKKYEIALLIKAAKKGDVNAVRSLLDKGIGVNSKGYKDRTALSGAVARGRTDVIKLLLDRGAHIGTAFIMAAKKGRTGVIKLLLDRGAQIDRGAQSKVKTENGLTALMMAAARGHTDVVKLLLDRGAQIETKNGNGDTALMFAKKYNKKAVVHILTNAGATE